MVIYESRSSTEISRVNQADNDDVTPLIMAAQKGYTEVVSLLLEHHAQVDFSIDNDYTPLFMAAGKGHTEVVRLLLQGPTPW